MTTPKLTDANDLEIKNGNLVLIEGIDEVVQRIRTRLNTVEGEWFLDRSLGIPLFTKVLVKRPNLGILNAVYTSEITSTPGVRSLKKLNFAFEKSTRVLKIDFHVQTTDGSSGGGSVSAEG